MSVPSRTNSDSYFGAAWNKAREAIRSHEPISAPGLRTGHTEHGLFREPDPPLPPYGQPAASAAGMAIYCEVSTVESVTFQLGLVIPCLVHGGPLDGRIIEVSRPPSLCLNIATFVVEETPPFNGQFTYTDPQSRTATAFGYVTEYHKIRPIYVTGGYLYALETPTGYIDLNVDARRWVSVPYVPVP